MDRRDYFSIYELHFLLDAFGGTVMMGLPTREDLTISSENIWKLAKSDLEEKGLVDSDGGLTKAGFVITEVLREYCTGKSLTVINNYYIMTSINGEFSIMIIDTTDGYQLVKLDSLILLKHLYEKTSLIGREPKEDEKTFLMKEIELTETLKELLVSDKAILIQNFPLLEMTEIKDSEKLISQLLVVEEDGELLCFNIQSEKLFRYSQYYFLERLYTWLSIPFRKEDFD